MAENLTNGQFVVPGEEETRKKAIEEMMKKYNQKPNWGEAIGAGISDAAGIASAFTSDRKDPLEVGALGKLADKQGDNKRQALMNIFKLQSMETPGQTRKADKAVQETLISKRGDEARKTQAAKPRTKKLSESERLDLKEYKKLVSDILEDRNDGSVGKLDAAQIEYINKLEASDLPPSQKLNALRKIQEETGGYFMDTAGQVQEAMSGLPKLGSSNPINQTKLPSAGGNLSKGLYDIKKEVKSDEQLKGEILNKFPTATEAQIKATIADMRNKQ